MLFKINPLFYYILLLIILLITRYSCEERFVIKVAPGKDPSILIDEDNFIDIINGIMPKSISSRFTANDMVSVIRKIKEVAIKEANPGNDVSTKNLLNLLKESQTKYTDKKEWVSGMFDAIQALMLSSSSKSVNIKPVSIKNDNRKRRK